LNVELANRTNSDAVVNSFEASMGNLEVGAPADVNGHPTFVNGPCAWILALGYANTGQYMMACKANTPVFETYFNSSVPSDTSWSGTSDETGWLYVWDSSNGDAAQWQKKIEGGMRYYYQWHWNNETLTEMGWNYVTDKPKDFTERYIDRWPLPIYEPDADYRFQIKEEFDATMLTAGEEFTLGTLGHYHRLRGIIESVGDNYIEITDDYKTETVSQMEIETWSPLYKMLWGEPIFYWPILHTDHWYAFYEPGDQYRLTQAFDMESDSVSEMFLGLLGNSTDGMSLPRRSRLHHVPDVWDDGADMRELIDWNRLAQLVPPSISGVIFRLQLGAAQNVGKLLFNVLLNHGIRQTWGYSESRRGWYMSFEPAGTANAAKALTSGRVLSHDNLISAEPVSVYGNTWLYHSVNAKLNYQADTAMVNLTMPNKTGRAMLASGNKTLKIDDKILQIDSSMEEDYVLSLRQMMHWLNSAQPSVKAAGTIAALPLAVVGGDCLITSELIYDLFAGSRGITRRAAMMTNVTTSIQKQRVSLGFELRLALGAKAIGPSLYIEAARMNKTGSVVTVTGLPTDPADNDFQNPIYTPNGLTDLAYFGCINYNTATDAKTLRNCSCDQYAIIMIDVNTTTWDNAGAGRNTFTGRLRGHTTDTLTLDDVANGRCRIDIDDDAGEFSVLTDKVIYFCDWNDADIQPCQEVYGWLGDEDGMIVDVDTNKSRCMTWS